MIKINLLKNSGGSSNLNTSITNMSGVKLHGSGESDSDFTDPKQTLAKVLAALALPFVLFVVDFYLGSQKESELQALTANVSQLQSQIASYGPKAESVKKFQEEKASLENRIGLIRDLSSARLKVIKSLNSLHTIVPEKSWLTNVDIKNGQFSIQGLATDDFVVSGLIQSLDESIFYSQVRLESSEETKVDIGNIRKYKISGKLGD